MSDSEKLLLSLAFLAVGFFVIKKSNGAVSDSIDEVLEMPLSVTDEILNNPNVKAFLKMLRYGEGTYDALGYRRVFGGQIFDSFADHPNIRIYERADEFIKNGKRDFTTAAGAYQITNTTWREVKSALSLNDFSPPSQDLAAVWLIKRRGALQNVLAGEIDEAIRKCRNEWASLPGSPYGQPTVALTAAINLYKTNGGIYA